jgi:type I restriction enzyme, S subunit
MEIGKLPDSWKKIRLGDVTAVLRGASPRPKGDSKYYGGNIPWIKISDVTSEPGKFLTKTVDTVTTAGAGKSRFLKKGSLILSICATVCVPKILLVDGCIHDGFVYFPNLPEDINQNFLYYYFGNIRPQVIQENRQGMTQVNLNTGIVSNFQIPIPPLSEQERIVAKIEELFTQLEAGTSALQRVQAGLRRYKASVLKAACEGKLVNGNLGDDFEPSVVALNKALEKRKSNKPPLSPPGDLPELPKDWYWATTDQLSDGSKYALKAGPFGSSLKKEYYVPKGYKIYGQEQVISGDPHFGDYYIDSKRYEQLKANAVKPGDTLISLVGTIGKVLILPENIEPGIINPRLVKLSLDKTLIDSKYFKIYMETEFAKHYFSTVSHGETMQILNLGILRQLPVPLPPLEEQRRIVAEVERRLSVARQVESSVEEALVRASRLRQAVLRSAFEGRLT